MSNVCVSSRPFTQVIQTWLSEHDEDDEQINTIAQLAELLGMDRENVRKLAAGKLRDRIGFDIADKIVTVCTGGFGWLEDPELEAIYQAFDFDWLDKTKPCAPAPCAA